MSKIKVSLNNVQIKAVVSGNPGLPIASPTTLGGIKVGECLKIEKGVLSVDTADTVEENNKKPVTSEAVNNNILSNLEIESLINSVI